MRNMLAGLALFCLASISGLAVETIPDVKTLADLRRLPAKRTADGFDVKVGIADPGSDAGPYKLIYCLADRKADLKSESSRGQYTLGPLGFDLLVSAQEYGAAKQEKMIRRQGNLLLFCQTLPIGTDDDVTVRVYSGDAVVYERDLGKSEHRPCYWTKFVATPDRLQQQARIGDTRWIVDRDPRLRCPAFVEWGNLLESRAAKGATTQSLPPDETPLPGGLILPAEWQSYYFPNLKSDSPLSLILKDDSFVISDNDLGWRGSPTNTLLARWWVNGRPIAIDIEHDDLLMKTIQSLQKNGEIKVAFGLPKFLGEPKAGDRIAVQLLYSNELEFYSIMHRMQAMQRALYSPKIPVPITSNRVDFTVDERLLSLLTK